MLFCMASILSLKKFDSHTSPFALFNTSISVVMVFLGIFVPVKSFLWLFRNMMTRDDLRREMAKYNKESKNYAKTI